MKQFEADQKRLKGILVNYADKKADLGLKEKTEREEIIVALKDCFRLFQIQFQDQTLRFDHNVTDLREKTSINENETINDLNEEVLKGEILKAS